jgi:hypothetical protein
MSDFLLVVPQGWIRINIEDATQIPGISAGAINSWVASGYFDILSTELVSLLPAGAVVLEAQVFNTDILLLRLE